MTKNFEDRLSEINATLGPVVKFINLFAGSLPAPIFYHSGKEHYGFRYGKPDARHFCLLKSVRAVSALKASVTLARAGFAQEFYVLMRTYAEFTTHIDFVLLEHNQEGNISIEAQNYLNAYFADFARNDLTDHGKIRLKQGTVHDKLGKALDIKSNLINSPETTSKLYSNIYVSFSHYVHGRYPEVMDMYGGEPARWHLDGMSATPKDNEVIEFLETAVTTILHSIRLMVQVFDLKKLLQTDPLLVVWYNSILQSNQEDNDLEGIF